MSTRLLDLVERFGGQLVGAGEVAISGVAPLEDAGTGQIAFLSNAKFRSRVTHCQAAALILSPSEDALVGHEFSGSRVVAANPYAYFAKVAQFFAKQLPRRYLPGIHPTACVAPSATVALTAHLGPYVVIEADAIIGADVIIQAGSFVGEGAIIGEGTHLHPRVTFEARCHIGARGIIYSGAVIGGEGFGFANESGAWIKIPQTGRVRIGDDVEIGANTCIDRGALADTIIEDGVKLDNQIQVGHNCHIGAHTAIAGCVGIAGSAVIGKYCTLGGAAMINGHITIGDKVHVAAGSLVTRSIAEPGEYAGFYPVTKKAEWEKSAVLVRNLGVMREKIRDLEKRVKSLTEKNNE